MPATPAWECLFYLELSASSWKAGIGSDSVPWPLLACTGLAIDKGLAECFQALAQGHIVGQ